jgi:hypothetical protein
LPNTASPLALELLAGHVLMMQCGAAAVRLLERAEPAGATAPLDLRAGEEAMRMAGLSARLMQYHTEGVRLLRRLPPAARAGSAAPAVQPASAVRAETPTALRKLHADPGVRRGRLKNGNPAGDYLKSPRCGARTRAGGCCRQPAMANGRCRLHGGLSTGPRTAEGLARCRAARLVHGYRSRAHLALRSRAVHAARRLRALTRTLTLSLSKGRAAAGHGVHRPDSAAAPRGTVGRAGSKLAAASTPAPVISAGHGVHRPDSVHHRDTEALSERVPQSPPSSLSSSASPCLCGESSADIRAISAGHGLHRSIRDHLRSSASIGGFQSFPPEPAASMRNFVLRSAGGLR